MHISTVDILDKRYGRRVIVGKIVTDNATDGIVANLLAGQKASLSGDDFKRLIVRFSNRQWAY